VHPAIARSPAQEESEQEEPYAAERKKSHVVGEPGRTLAYVVNAEELVVQEPFDQVEQSPAEHHLTGEVQA